MRPEYDIDGERGSSVVIATELGLYRLISRKGLATIYRRKNNWYRVPWQLHAYD